MTAPTGPVILSVTGNITRTNAPGRPDFDRDMLEALGIVTIKTETDWTKGTIEFAGPLVLALLDAVGAQGQTATAGALNDYKVEIPLVDFRRYPVLLALKSDGAYMTTRNKGPIWIVYPRDQHPELNTPVYKAGWAWQLRILDIR
ncbi:MAG: oxidoreductase [Alphaproteobacteria bacterium]|nr:oxidoreductase [Alphaproteobacteria bacterium]